MIIQHGVYPILPTPFTENGDVDVDSIRRLIDYQKATGVAGVAVLGFMGEADKLSAAERRLVLQTAVQQASNDLAVWVGVRTLGTMSAVEAVQAAEGEGAATAFVAPCTVQDDAEIYRHYERVKTAVSIPIMIHDYPASFGTTLSPELIVRLGQDGICNYIKLEDPPVGPKLTKIRELSNDTVGVFGGLGGFYFLEELERGAMGIATGFGFSEVLVHIYNLYASGDHEAAARSFHHYAALIRYEFQPKLGLAFRKHLYHRRGIFSTTVVRHPAGVALDPYSMMEYERIIGRCGLHLDGTAPQQLV